MPKIFISYRRYDSADATGRLYDRLKAHFGSESVFYDVDTIPIGVDFRKHLGEQVGKCDVFLAIIGDNWLSNCYEDGPKKGQRRLDDPVDWVRIEIEAALTREIPVVPVLVGRARMPDQNDLPSALMELVFRHAAEVRSGADYDGQTTRLIRAIERTFANNPGHKEAPQKGESECTQSPKTERKPGDVITNGLGMKFAWIPPGTFMMGSPSNEEGCGTEEAPQHKVTLTKGFYMGVYTVTQEQWKEIMGNNPSNLKGVKNLPVENVSWDDCQEFIKKLQNRDKKPYRLPTEAEWEYACRAGTTTPFYFGETISTDLANYNGKIKIYGNGKKGIFREKTTPAGSFPANPWGLEDMHGNVWEWCQDWLETYPKNDVVDPLGPDAGEYRVLRGGSWHSEPSFCRSAYRFYGPAGDRHFVQGFRLCFFDE